MQWLCLSSWWLNQPVWKNARHVGSFRQGSGGTYKKHLKPPTSIQLLTQSTKKASRISKNTSGRCRFMAMLGLAGHNLGLARIPVMSWSLDSWEMGVFHKVTATSGPKKTQKSLALKKIQTWMLVVTHQNQNKIIFSSNSHLLFRKRSTTPLQKQQLYCWLLLAYKSEFSLKQIAAKSCEVIKSPPTINSDHSLGQVSPWILCDSSMSPIISRLVTIDAVSPSVSLGLRVCGGWSGWKVVGAS